MDRVHALHHVAQNCLCIYIRIYICMGIFRLHCIASAASSCCVAPITKGILFSFLSSAYLYALIHVVGAWRKTKLEKARHSHDTRSQQEGKYAQ